MYIPAYQTQAGLSDTLEYLASTTEDGIILVSTPAQLMFPPEPQQGKYYTLLHINGDPSIDCGPVFLFAATTLLKASPEGQPDGMVTHVKLLPCFGSSKRPKTELIEEPVLIRGTLWQNIHFIEWKGNNVYQNRAGKPICQEVTISMGARIKYIHTGIGFIPLLMVMACTPT